ncbi:MAG: MFS transporter [Candidatus Eremiobacteraeota bacterium]|nr:MFS transporter [Candidatus Eremiobacteraeota bacterium]MBC5827235.1 MFS transporter [Candidatus Eremiobacteraeota bacterium]
MRQLFRERDFLAFFIARQSVILAYSIESAAIGWQIYSLRHRPFDLGLVGLILFLPQLVLALPAGILADRWDRRRICVYGALAETSGLCLIGVLSASGNYPIAVYFWAVAFIGIAHSVGTPAERSVLAGIVRSHQFVRAQAISSSAGQLVIIAGPAIAGVLIAIRTPIAFAVSAVCYLSGAAAFSFLNPRDVRVDDDSLWKSAILGLRFIFSRKVLLGAISLDLFAVLFGGAISLLPIYATQILHVGPLGFGALRSAPAVGSAVVAVIIARHPIDRRAGPLLFWCVAGFGVFTIVFGISTNFALSLLALALSGGFDMVSVVIRSVLVQLRSPDEMRGRVSAVENVFIGASNQLGMFESGTLAALLGTQVSVVVGGAATLAIISLWAKLFPALRKFDRLMAEYGGCSSLPGRTRRWDGRFAWITDPEGNRVELWEPPRR